MGLSLGEGALLEEEGPRGSWRHRPQAEREPPQFRRAELSGTRQTAGRHPAPGDHGTEESPPRQHQLPGPGPAQQPHRQESSPNFCEQDKHTARPGLTQLPLGWAPNHQRNSLPAQAPGFPHIRALGFWFEVLSSGIPFGGSQTQALGSMVQRLNQSPRFRMQALACRSSPGLWFVPPGVGSLVKRSTLLASSQALCSVSI